MLSPNRIFRSTWTSFWVSFTARMAIKLPQMETSDLEWKLLVHNSEALICRNASANLKAKLNSIDLTILSGLLAPVLVGQEVLTTLSTTTDLNERPLNWRWAALFYISKQGCADRRNMLDMCYSILNIAEKGKDNAYLDVKYWDTYLQIIF